MKWLYGGLAVLALALLAAGAAVGWLVGTEPGLHWAAGKVPGLSHEGLRGRLAGEVFAEKLVFEREGTRVAADKLNLTPHLAALLGGRLTIEPLRVAALEIRLPDAPREAGGDFKPPALRLHVGKAAIDTIEIIRGESRYVLKEVRIDHASVGPGVSAAGSVYWPDERFATRARLELRGSLDKLEAHVVADVAGVAADARAVLFPAARERLLQSLELRAGPVDASRFSDAAPHTALTATVHAGSTAGGALAGTLSLANAEPGPLDADRLPFTRLEARFLTDFGSARLERMRIALAGAGTVQGDAEIERERVRAELVAAAVDLRAIHSRLRRTSLHGPLQVQVDGERQWARGSLTQEGIGLTAEVLRTGERVEVRELKALADGGEVSGTGTLDGGRAFNARIELSRFNPAAIGEYPPGAVTGTLSARGTLEPRDIALEWRLGESTLYGHAFRSDGAAQLAGSHVTRADAEVRLGANRLSARGAFGRPGDALALVLHAPRLEEFAPAGGSVSARGTLTGTLERPRAAVTAEATALVLPGGTRLEKAAAKLAGTLAAHEAELAVKAPELAVELAARLRGGWSAERGWTGEMLSLENAGAYPLTLVAPAALRVAPGRVDLGRFEARVADGRLLVREASWSRGRIASSGEFARLPAQWLIDAAGMSERLSATLLVDGEWELAQARALQGFARLRRADGDLALVGADVMGLGLEAATLEARFVDGRASGRLEAASRVARVSLQGDLLPELAVQGKLEFADLATLTRPLFQEVRLDGRLAAELRITGTPASPLVHGTLGGEALAFELPLYGIALREGTLKAVLEGDTLRLESLAARGREGRFTANGRLPLGPRGAAQIAWRADKLTLLDRPDLRLVASGEGEASYDGKRAALRGDVRADRGHFEYAREKLPKLGSDVVVLGRPAPPAKAPMRLPLELDLRLDLGDNLVVRGYGYDGRVTGLVDLATNKQGELRAYGRVQAVHATFLAYGQRLAVDPGVVIFDGPIDNPSLQITAWRRNQAVEAGVQVTGTVRAPLVQLVSQPPVPEGERLSWLVLGRPPSGATQADLGLLQAAAGALLSSSESVPLDRKIARRFGLDELGLRGSGEFADRVIAVGKRLSDRLYISYEQGLGAVATNLIKLDFALGRRWTLRAETGTSSGGGLFYRYSWD